MVIPKARALWVRALVVATATLVAAPSWAVLGLQGTATVSVGVTDNVDSSPTEPIPGTKGRQTDLISTLTPGLLLTAGNARALLRLGYTFNAILYARNSDANTYQNSVAGNAFFLPSKRTTMTLGFNLSEGRQSTFNNLVDSANPQVQVQPAAVINVLSITADQALAWEITRRWRLTEQVGFSTAYFLDQSPPQATTQTVPARLGAEYSFAHDIVGADVGVGYSRFLEQRGPVVGPTGVVDPDGVISPEQHQITLQPMGRWRRDLTYFMAMRAELGAFLVIDPTDPSRRLSEPAGGVGLNFLSRLATFDLGYTHSASPNLLFRSNFIADTAAIRGVFLLGERTGFGLSVGLGYSYNRQLDGTATIVSRSHAIAADATLSYAPRNFISMFLRYQVTDQIGNRDDVTPIPTYYRNTLLFGISAIYPPEVAAEVPKKPLGLRADGRDAPTVSPSKSTPR